VLNAINNERCPYWTTLEKHTHNVNESGADDLPM
jgi:hypothetical protein